MEKIVLVLLSFLVCQVSIIIDAEVNYRASYCINTDLNKTVSSFLLDENLYIVFDQLSLKTSSLKFYNYTIGVAPDQIYALYQCRYDLSLNVCGECVKNATQSLMDECPSAREGIIWYEECMFRYANHSIYYFPDTDHMVFRASSVLVANYKEFAPILASEMQQLIEQASSALPHFASGQTNLSSSNNLYSFAQCTDDLDNSNCSSCLKTVLHEMASCCNASVGVWINIPSCELRYDMKPFLNDFPSLPRAPPAIHKGTSMTTSLNSGIIAAIAASSSVGLLVLLVVFGICFCRKKPKKASTDVFPTSPLHDVRSDGDGLGDTEYEQYRFKTLKIATRDFSDENMLGEGGFGIVYKGIHKNGQELAIKRLSGGTSGQGTKEFMTEARILAKLQHRNLVKLLGFCSEGDEKLLVYEFMPNSSLDGFLFDQAKRPLLDWVTRKQIITGIARGLQYLHEDSRLTIIHRDLKPGNILLDMYMNPKIADFGLAKLSETAQKFGNTARVAGTQGYMAPEYLMTGDYSDKTDVYSFGIMLLEIVSGRRNRINRQTPQQEDLSIQAWRLWNEERSFEITDPILLDNCPNNEVTRYIQIGLLCVQANAEERPTMSAVVFMLTCSTDIPLPSTPIMNSRQCNMLMNYSNGQESDVDRSSTKSITVTADVTHDFNPKPR